MNRDERSRARLDYWKTVVRRDEAAWAVERDKMDWREEQYEGSHKLKPTVAAEERIAEELRCYHVRNVIAENIETMVDSRIPKPKVIPLRKENEHLARTLEHMLAFYTRRRHCRILNDLSERMTPIQGGCAYLVEWDNTIKTSDGMGDVTITLLHPKQLIPQAGIYTDIEDMDHICVKLAYTRQQVRRRFGVDVSGAIEEDPEARGRDEETGSEADLVTVMLLYYRNERGGIGMMAWADDTILADLDDYQARRLRRCKQCGALDSYTEPALDAEREELELSGQEEKGPHRCLWCEGTEFTDETVDEEAVMTPKVLLTSLGQEIELKGAKAWTDEKGRLRMEPESFIPYYKPNRFPVILQKNISKFGQLLGESDVDKMEDQQNTIKRLDKKILDRIVKSGTKIGLPPDVNIETSTEDQEVFRFKDPAKAAQIRTYEFTGDISAERNMTDRVYEEARQGAGITDSMQGRRDPTATSGAAKEFAAGKSEGRMQSRRVMKQEAWARIYEMIAKLMIAYADEPRRIRVESQAGETEYEEFRKEMFLQIDDKMQIYYEDGFIFETDDATSLADNREAMWQELNRAFSSRTLGDPASVQTLVLYWGLMEEQGYPGAASIREKLEQQMEQMQAQAAAAQAQGPVPGQAGVPSSGAGAPPYAEESIYDSTAVATGG